MQAQLRGWGPAVQWALRSCCEARPPKSDEPPLSTTGTGIAGCLSSSRPGPRRRKLPPSCCPRRRRAVAAIIQPPASARARLSLVRYSLTGHPRAYHDLSSAAHHARQPYDKRPPRPRPPSLRNPIALVTPAPLAVRLSAAAAHIPRPSCLAHSPGLSRQPHRPATGRLRTIAAVTPAAHRAPPWSPPERVLPGPDPSTTRPPSPMRRALLPQASADVPAPESSHVGLRARLGPAE